MIHKHLIALLAMKVMFLSVLLAQNNPFSLPNYDFVKYDKNKITFYGDSIDYLKLYQQFDNLILRGEGSLNIVHMGGSHIQAGVLSGHFADRLQNLMPNLKGSQGFAFPYSVARSNNPHNYAVTYTGKWKNERSVNQNKKAPATLGLSGISLSTNDCNSTISFRLRPAGMIPSYSFNKVKIFHSFETYSFALGIDSALLKEAPIVNKELGYTELRFKESSSFFTLKLNKLNPLQKQFTFYGLSFETDESGITYHGIGINGASIPCYLQSELMGNHLKALNPNLIILTLGTNDTYTSNFQPSVYEANYSNLLDLIKKNTPDAVVLMTVPNDDYLYRKAPNKNIEKAKDVIVKLAKKRNLAVWDFYSIMGGSGAIALWEEAGLASHDKVHLTGKGYFLQADLLFNAFLQSYINYLEKDKQFASSVLSKVN